MRNSVSTTINAKKNMELLYNSKLEQLPITYEMKRIETSFGETNILITGEKSNPPLLLIHGYLSCAPHALEAMIGLKDHFRIYAIDVIGQPNLSEDVRPCTNDNSYGKWMFEITTRLNVQDSVLVGISFGGFIGWKSLAFDARRISRAFLIAPAGIIEGNPLQPRGASMKTNQLRMPIKYSSQFLNELFSDTDEHTFVYLNQTFENYDIDFSKIQLLKKEDAKKIKTPLHIIAMEEDLFFPGRKLLNRAEELFITPNENMLLKKSKHFPSQKDYQRIVDFIIKKYG